MTRIALPTLSDGVVALRPWRTADADALAVACQDPEIPRWTAVPPRYRRTDALQFLSVAHAGAERGSMAAFAAVDGGGRLLGSFTVMDIDRERGSGELGYWVARDARGRGVATRALALLCAWARRDLGLAVLELLAHRDNQASIRVAARAGFAPTGELRAIDKDPASGRAYRVFVSRAPSAA
jgi:RimJ/RimL family protein N-acetyltransferase